MFDEMEVLVFTYKWPPSEIKSFSVRERSNWVLRALERADRQRRLMGND